MKILAAICFLLTPLFAQSVKIAPATFTGSGLNDATSGGLFTCAPTYSTYTITVSATGTPDHFTWQLNGGAASSPVAITGAAQTLSCGVTITFAATTGHTLADSWSILGVGHGSLNGINFLQGQNGSRPRTAEDKSRDTVSVLDFPTADPTGVGDSTPAFVSGVAAANSTGACLYVPRGMYKVFNATGFASMILSSSAKANGCVRGDGPGQTVILQATNGGTTIALQGAGIVVKDLTIAKYQVITTGTASSGSTALTVASGAGIQPGYAVNGTNIYTGGSVHGGTTVVSVTGTAVVLSHATLGAISGTTATFGPVNGTAISLYPDVTASGPYSAVMDARLDNLQIDSAFCNELNEGSVGGDCVGAANLNRLVNGILLQSGHYDTVYNSIFNTRVTRADDCYYTLSGGYAGSSEFGIVNATHYTNDIAIACTDAGLRLDSSGENTVANFTADYSDTEVKFATQTAGTWAGVGDSGNKIEAVGEGSTHLLDVGDSSSTNFYMTPRTALLGVGAGGFIGSNLENNTIITFDNLLLGLFSASDGFLNIGLVDITQPRLPTATLQINESTNVKDVLRSTAVANPKSPELDHLHFNPFGASLAHGTVTSGISATGPTNSTCTITVTSGSVNATLVVQLTSLNTIASGTAFSVKNGLSGIFTTAPTSGTATNGTAACSGTAVISTVLTLPGFIERTDSTFPKTQPVHRFVQGANLSGTDYMIVNLDHDTGGGSVTPMTQIKGQYVNTASTAATTASLGAINGASTLVYPHEWGGDGLDRNNLGVVVSGGLPACSSSTVQWTANVTDATSSVLGSVIAGGGTNNVAARCDYDGSSYAWHATSGSNVAAPSGFTGLKTRTVCTTISGGVPTGCSNVSETYLNGLLQ